jgi:hypothetical protein
LGDLFNALSFLRFLRQKWRRCGTGAHLRACRTPLLRTLRLLSLRGGRRSQTRFFGQNDLKKRSKTARIKLEKEILIHFYPLFIGVKRILSDGIKRVVDINRGKVR